MLKIGQNLVMIYWLPENGAKVGDIFKVPSIALDDQNYIHHDHELASL